MKKLLLLLIITMLSIGSVVAQHSKQQKKNFKLRAKSKQKVIKQFANVNAARQMKAKPLAPKYDTIYSQTLEEDVWKTNFRVVFTYSEDNLTISRTGELESEGEFVPFTKYESIFNENGFLQSVKIFTFNGIGFSETENDNYYYDSEERLDSVVFVEDDEGTIYKSTTKLTYVTSDSITYVDKEYEDGELTDSYEGYFVQDGVDFIDYYEDNRYISFNVFLDDILANTSNQYFLYSTQTELKNGGTWEPVERYTYHIDDVSGKYIEGFFDEYLEGEWVTLIDYDFEYSDSQLSIVQENYLDEEQNYSFRDSITYKGLEVSNEFEDEIVKFKLSQNYPNPFNPNTSISYTIPEATNVKLEVFNLTGQRVALLVNERKSKGVHSVNLSADTFASGLYIYRIRAEGFVQTKKMLLIK